MVFDVGLLDGEGSVGLSDDSLGDDLLVSLLSLLLGLVVETDPVEEIFPGGGLLDVLNADVDALGDDPVADLLVDDDAHGSRVHVEDSPRLTVVVLVGHALVDGSVHGNIDDFASLVGCERPRDVDSTCLSESLLELVSGSASVAVCVCHSPQY